MVKIMYKYNLNDVEWGNFFVKEIFEIEKCKCSKVSSLTEGKIPYVGATNRNNGVLSFVDGEIKLITKGNCIAFICDGEGSIGYSMYKEEDFIGSTTVKVGRNKRLNKYNAKFISTIADTVRSKYNFGFKRNEEHLKKEILQLPIDVNNEPNWHFMEEYIKEREIKQRKELKEYYKSRLLDLVICPEVLTDVEWGEFFIGGNDGIFDITATKSGIDKNKLNIESGNVPYITRSEIDNGINLFIINKQKEKYKQDEGNAITIGLDTQTVFYQSNSFFTGQNIQVLRNENLNKNNAMFIIPLLKIQMQKFNWGGNGATLGRLNRTKIALPIDLNGEPNWAYMENFIKNIEQKQIKNILKYLDEYI
ncbi:restriction endonuclease subunit S [Campylobacter sp. faydin G-24]|uniref:Restriction endonuclease subunit S n=1 Tax=Campylobacter anatolicus TaxID=2829105 RepID=A0ABS5HFP7_9BACT|nr:restriction endonuclease subunit S [Campylobacter anatolicus]MBR8463099.1 restriction endonuclease subunit S [Campylobacter anatolicus]